MQRNIMLHAQLADCEQLTNLTDVQRLVKALMQGGIKLIVVLRPGAQGVTLSESETDDYFARTWPSEDFEASKQGKMVLGYGRKLLVSGMEGLQWHFQVDFRAGHMGVYIGGLIDFEFLNQQTWVEPYAQRLRELAKALYPELKPSLAAVSEFSTRLIHGDVLKRELRCINWVNIFGPPYVEKYGRKFLLGLPGYQSKELPDGAIYHQLTPSFLTTDPKGAKTLRQEVLDYCAGAGLKVVCKAPYHLPGVSSDPAAAAQSPDRELRSYLKNILSTTLLLKDGTRVKPVYVQWDKLTDRQRQMALAAIRSAAIAEIREHRNSPIRFEFNALPEDLNALMADLMGQDNPDFVYVQVDMDPGHAD